MKLSLVFGLVLVTLVAALPRYPPRAQPKAATSDDKWYNGLVHLTAVALSHTFYAGSQPGLSSQQALIVACALGLSFNPHTRLCELPEPFLPDASHPNGHGTCPEDKFWFGPRQTCVGGAGSEDVVAPPAGYYCPLNWSFSARYSCCVPDSPAALDNYSCSNGNGSWSLIRIACVERQTSELR
ncbi:hypothetical protein BDV93DRAFT_520018 [Ceratobasidium sp. AG-I]|nr:hypothetical protein BDV93DRAFT_520018 [Ceratobasidium sp. AG-I]